MCHRLNGAAAETNTPTGILTIKKKMIMSSHIHSQAFTGSVLSQRHEISQARVHRADSTGWSSRRS